MSLPEKMTAAVLYGPGDIRVTEVDVPKPGYGEVLIKVMACAICGSDLSLIRRAWPGQPPYGEFVPGHEYSGIIAALGHGIDEFQVGDRVAVEVHKGCGRCTNCRQGNYTSCLNYGSLAKGHRANGFTCNGGYAQYVVNHVSTVYQVPDNISFEEASLVTTAGCPLYGFEVAGGAVAGQMVLVTGPGPMGLMAVQIARAMGARQVILTGTRESRLRIGKQLGADYTIDVHENNPVESVQEISEGGGVDLAVECSGSEAGIETVIQSTRKSGRIILIGFPQEPVRVDLGTVAKNNLTIYGVRGEGMASCSRVIELMAQGKLNASSLITHRFPLANIGEALDTFERRTGGAIKVILSPH